MNYKILIVEDDAIIALNLKNILMRNGFIIPQIIYSGDDYEKIKFDENYDLIISDINIGGRLNGYELSEMVKNKYNIPIIFFTNTTDEDILKNILLINPYGYFPKSFNEDLLIKFVNLTIEVHKKQTIIKSYLSFDPLTDYRQLFFPPSDN